MVMPSRTADGRAPPLILTAACEDGMQRAWLFLHFPGRMLRTMRAEVEHRGSIAYGKAAGGTVVCRHLVCGAHKGRKEKTPQRKLRGFVFSRSGARRPLGTGGNPGWPRAGRQKSIHRSETTRRCG